VFWKIQKFMELQEESMKAQEEAVLSSSGSSYISPYTSIDLLNDYYNFNKMIK